MSHNDQNRGGLVHRRSKGRPAGDPAVDLFNAILSSVAPEAGPGLSWFDFNPAGFTPLSETLHEGDDYLIRLEVPGISPEEIEVELNENRLIITGEKRAAELADGVTRKLTEVRYGSFKRVYPVPSRVEADSISATYEQGVLTVRVKDAFSTSEGVKINVEAN